jgi:hypothetical protein
MPPIITIDPLPRTGDRDDFSVRVVGPGDTDHTFRLAMTRTALTMWNADSAAACTTLAGTLVHSHGTASAFPNEGFWFDSHNSADTVHETENKIRSSGWNRFVHPAAKESLGAALFNALARLDELFSEVEGRPFLRSLDILFEQSQALEDLETEASDNPHFIYRVCILSAVVDRFDFEHGEGSLNGLRTWLAQRLGDARAGELTRPFQQVKNLRKQYPIHEHFEVNAGGERQRRAEVVRAEQHFGLREDPTENWHRVLTDFSAAVEQLIQAIGELPADRRSAE